MKGPDVSFSVSRGNGSLRVPQLSLALAICEVCPASEVDSLISVMLNLFDTRSALMTLLKNMIDLEVSRTGGFELNTLREFFLKYL